MNKINGVKNISFTEVKGMLGILIATAYVLTFV